MPKQRGSGAGQEVPALDQHIGGNGELGAGARAHERRIVSDAEDRARRTVCEEAPDDLEFREP